MNDACLKLTLALLFACGAGTAAPLVAQDGVPQHPPRTPVPGPAPAVALVPDAQHSAFLLSRSDFQAKGPVSIWIDHFGPNAQRKKLALVPRALVVGANAGTVIGGIALSMAGLGGTIRGVAKEDFYGIQNHVAKSSDRLANPLLHDIPAAIDETIAALVADDPDLNGTKYNEPLHLSAGAWILVYDELMSDSDNYYLLFRAGARKRLEGEKQAMFRDAKQHIGGCVYQSEVKPLSVWEANDYEAVGLEKKKATDSCINAITAGLPQMLGMDPDSKIRTAKLTCKTTYSKCVAALDNAPDQVASKNVCKAEQKQCISDEVKPLVDVTPLGQCKVTLLACRATLTEKFQLTSPEGKPGRAAFSECAAEYKTCVAPHKKGSFLPPLF